MADKNAFVLQDDCSYCGAQEKEGQKELLYECSNCGTLYCDSCGEDKGCPNCGAPMKGLGQQICEYCGSPVVPVDTRVWRMVRFSEVDYHHV